MLSTIIIICIVVLFVLLGIRRGAAKTLLHFAAMLANAFISHFLGGLAAQWVYDSFIKSSVLAGLERSIAENGVTAAAQNSLSALPDNVYRLFRTFGGMFGVAPEDLQGRLVLSGSETEAMARTLEKPVGELTVFLLTVVCSLVLFFLLWIVFKLLIRATLHVFELPVVRQVNHLLGGVFGLLEGAVLVCFLANILYLLLSCLNPTALDSSVFGGLFSALVIFK